jgi:amino acid permease
MAKTSNWQTFILLVKGNIGPGCLALPFCFSMLGPYVSLSFVLFIGFFCIYNMWVLVQCKRKIPGIKTYGELASATLGSYGEALVEFFLALMQLSICCVYFSFIGDSLEPLLGVSQRIITMLLVVPVLLLTNLRHMSELAPLSMIASASLCVALILILSASVHRFFDDSYPDIPIYRSSKIVPFFVSTIYAYEGWSVPKLHSPNR